MKNQLKQALNHLEEAEKEMNTLKRGYVTRGILLDYYTSFVNENGLQEQFEAHKQKVNENIQREQLLAQIDIQE